MVANVIRRAVYRSYSRRKMALHISQWWDVWTVPGTDSEKIMTGSGWFPIQFAEKITFEKEM